MGKLTISMAIFNSYVSHKSQPEGTRKYQTHTATSRIPVLLVVETASKMRWWWPRDWNPTRTAVRIKDMFRTTNRKQRMKEDEWMLFFLINWYWSLFPRHGGLGRHSIIIGLILMISGLQFPSTSHLRRPQTPSQRPSVCREWHKTVGLSFSMDRQSDIWIYLKQPCLFQPADQLTPKKTSCPVIFPLNRSSTKP